MKDLDFDELDRAVHSVMSGGKRPAESPSGQGNDAATRVDGTSGTKDEPTQSNSAMPTPMTVLPEPEPIKMEANPVPARMSELAASPRPSVATRRGRFMDVVRPGAASQPVEAATRPISRQAMTVEPSRLVTDIIPPSATPPVAKKEPPVVTPETPRSKRGEATWPDPIDLLDFEDDEPTVADIPAANTDDARPLVSPFLSGTKVEKRPLGNKAAVPEPAPQETEKEERQPDTSPQLSAHLATDQDQPLPEELSSDVVALESDANIMAMPTEEVKTEVIKQIAEQENEPKQVSEPIPTPKPAQDTPTSSLPAKLESVEPITPKGPISIPQQYREEPSTGDAGNGAIYDTDTYHQPLAHPKKKKSGWLWVVWIVLILVLGAAGGAALFMLGVF